MRVVLLILDSMPHRRVNETDTPSLWAQRIQGGWAPNGGQSLPISVTYSNHASFVTGLSDVETGLWGNYAWTGTKFEHTATAGPRGLTLFERCTAAGKRSISAVGDHKIVTTIGAQKADQSWPPTAEVPPGTPVDPYGYPADSAVIEELAKMDLTADLCLVHLNEPDTTLHLHGPDSPEATEQIRNSDASHAQVIEQLRPGWEDTIVFSISDHEQEQITSETCIDLKGALSEMGVDATVANEGTGAVIIGSATAAQVETVVGVEGARLAGTTPEGHTVVYAWTGPGDMFGSGPIPTYGNHGSPRCRTQMAIVSGGHAEVPRLANQLETTVPTSQTWAPLIAELLQL